MVGGHKRQRTGGFLHQSKRVRPIDKRIAGVELALTATADSERVLYTATYPSTVVGVRWDFSSAVATDALVNVYWAVIILREGDDAQNLGFGNGSTLYQPEQDVLTWGFTKLTESSSTAGPGIVHEVGETKTMRKLQGGDRLVLLAGCDVAVGANLAGYVQFFLRG